MIGIHKNLQKQTAFDLAKPLYCGAGHSEALLERPAGSETRESHKNRARSFYRIETALAAVAAALAAVSGVCPDWIERVFRVGPDHDSGSLEWNIAIACAVGAALIAAMVRRNWRKSPATA